MGVISCRSENLAHPLSWTFFNCNHWCVCVCGLISINYKIKIIIFWFWVPFWNVQQPEYIHFILIAHRRIVNQIIVCLLACFFRVSASNIQQYLCQIRFSFSLVLFTLFSWIYFLVRICMGVCCWWLYVQ